MVLALHRCFSPHMLIVIIVMLFVQRRVHDGGIPIMHCKCANSSTENKVSSVQHAHTIFTLHTLFVSNFIIEKNAHICFLFLHQPKYAFSKAGVKPSR